MKCCCILIIINLGVKEKKKYILVDRSKFDHRKFHKFADLEEVTIVSYDVQKNYEKYANVLIVKDKEEA